MPTKTKEIILFVFSAVLLLSCIISSISIVYYTILDVRFSTIMNEYCPKQLEIAKIIISLFTLWSSFLSAILIIFYIIYTYNIYKSTKENTEILVYDKTYLILQLILSKPEEKTEEDSLIGLFFESPIAGTPRLENIFRWEVKNNKTINGQFNLLIECGKVNSKNEFMPLKETINPLGDDFTNNNIYYHIAGMETISFENKIEDKDIIHWINNAYQGENINNYKPTIPSDAKLGEFLKFAKSKEFLIKDFIYKACSFDAGRTLLGIKISITAFPEGLPDNLRNRSKSYVEYYYYISAWQKMEKYQFRLVRYPTKINN